MRHAGDIFARRSGGSAESDEKSIERVPCLSILQRELGDVVDDDRPAASARHLDAARLTILGREVRAEKPPHLLRVAVLSLVEPFQILERFPRSRYV